MKIYIPESVNISTKIFKQFVKADSSLCGVSSPTRKNYLYHQAIDAKLDTPDRAVVRTTANEPIVGLMPIGYFEDYVLLGNSSASEVYAVPTRRMVSWLIKLKRNINEIAFQWAYFLKGSECVQAAALIPVEYLGMRDAKTLELVYELVDPATVISLNMLERNPAPAGMVLRDVAYEESYMLLNTLNFDYNGNWMLNVGATNSPAVASLHYIELMDPKISSGLYVASEGSLDESLGREVDVLITKMANSTLADLESERALTLLERIPAEQQYVFCWLSYLVELPTAEAANKLAIYWLLFSEWQKQFSQRARHRPMLYAIRTALSKTMPHNTNIELDDCLDRLNRYCPYTSKTHPLCQAFLKGAKLYWEEGSLFVKYKGQKDLQPLASLVAYTSELLDLAITNA